MTQPIQGSCLCERVRYQVTGPFEVFHLCHCSQCRRSTGTAHAANCALRNPDRQIYEIFPDATTYRSVVAAVGTSPGSPHPRSWCRIWG